MPDLSFRPDLERHTTLAALARCPAAYRWLDRQRHGLDAAPPKSEGLLVGLGVDEGVAELWRGGWQPSTALAKALAAVQDEWERTSYPAALRATVEELVSSGVLAYAAQWQGIPRWELIAAHPYLEPEWQERLTLPGGFLAMPDLIVRDRFGTVLAVDVKTGVRTYDSMDWVLEPQQLTQALAVQQAFPYDHVGYQLDYAQKPGKGRMAHKSWTFPPTEPFMLDEQKAALAREWLEEMLMRRTRYDGYWPRDPGACRTRYGWCEHRARCFGGVDDSGTEAA